MKKTFYLRISATAARRAAACFLRHLRDLGAGLIEKGEPGTVRRGSVHAARNSRIGYRLYGTGVCSFQGAHDAPTSAFTALTLRFSEEMVARYPAVLTQLIVVAPSAPIFGGASREPITMPTRNVCYWPLANMTKVFGDVRFRR